ncbi:MAG TPA: hypothetical protein VJL58_09565, partial [Pyrinomonadaceae bacterium]|nr:hypothetical protein [Pyrinomonadaceae bacterium]
MPLNTFRYSLPDDIESAVREELAAWNEKVPRVWAKDASVWTNDDEAKWLGWLDIVGEELGDLQKYKDLADDAEQFDTVVLLGMGGSSLCPEVLSITFGKCDFHILDSTVPAQVKALEEKIDVTKTLFIVASKSGSTLEPNCFKQYFFDRVAQTTDTPGNQFVAITDPGSKMEQVAKADGFRHIFYGRPEIGGRFSALSVFGMCAAAAMGIDVETFLKNANEMVEACSRTNDNPGVILGTILGVCHKLGRDKLTIFTSPEIYDLGAWLEQLIAESTGKNGVAIIPVDREHIVPADHYGNDRVFVYLSVDGPRTSTSTSVSTASGSDRGGSDDSHILALHALEAAENPVIRITLSGETATVMQRTETAAIYTLGQEFFRWEFATAVAGSIMGINPFNQP